MSAPRFYLELRDVALWKEGALTLQVGDKRWTTSTEVLADYGWAITVSADGIARPASGGGGGFNLGTFG